jgi:hypothetical protein
MDMDVNMQHPSDNTAGRRRRAKWGLDRTANHDGHGGDGGGDGDGDSACRQTLGSGPGEADATRGRARLSESGSAGGDEARQCRGGAEGVESRLRTVDHPDGSRLGERELRELRELLQALAPHLVPHTPAAWRQ